MKDVNSVRTALKSKCGRAFQWLAWNMAQRNVIEESCAFRIAASILQMRQRKPFVQARTRLSGRAGTEILLP